MDGFINDYMMGELRMDELTNDLVMEGWKEKRGKDGWMNE